MNKETMLKEAQRIIDEESSGYGTVDELATRLYWLANSPNVNVAGK